MNDKKSIWTNTPVNVYKKTCSDCGSDYDFELHNECPKCKSKNTVDDVTSNSRKEELQSVKVVDFDMSFGNMVKFMVKWVIASIPAMIILFFIWMALMMIFGGSVVGLMNI